MTEKRAQSERAELAKRPAAPVRNREVIGLHLEQLATKDIEVLPSAAWSLRYAVDQVRRTQLLQGVLDGQPATDELFAALKPDALLYDTADIETQGVIAVQGRIREISTAIKDFSPYQYVDFLTAMRESGLPLQELDRVYRATTQSRIQKREHAAFGRTGQGQYEAAFKAEAARATTGLDQLPRSERVMQALKTRWLHEQMKLATDQQLDEVTAQLSADERDVTGELYESYKQYVDTGEAVDFKKLVGELAQRADQLKPPPPPEEASQSMQELEKELEEYKDDVVPPGAEGDPAIPPDDQDEYHTPPPPPEGGEAGEKVEQQPIFTIEPPLGGFYISGRKSYYDIDSKTWSKKKQLSPYQGSPLGDERHTLSGYLADGTKSLPIPNNYALDAASLVVDPGLSVTLHRDQTGCFYAEVTGRGTFTIDFLKEIPPFGGSVIDEDKALLTNQPLSTETEAMLARLSGSSLERAEQARQYLLAHHFYPGGGDLDLAQALQYKLRSTTTGETYIQALDASEYLECYSANTLFIAMVRRVGVPARLVIGDKVEGAKGGKSAITERTGHAWAEVWDGMKWRRFDATPRPKPEDKTQPSPGSEEGEPSEPAREADDDGVDRQPSSQIRDGEPSGSSQPGQPGQSSEGTPWTDLPEASSEQAESAQSALEQARQRDGQIQAKKQQMNQRVNDAKSFKDLSQMKQELEQDPDYYEDMKKDLEKRLDTQADSMKDELREKLESMEQDGFLNEQQKEEILQSLKDNQIEKLDTLFDKVDRDVKLYEAYNALREEVKSDVRTHLRLFVDSMPPSVQVSVDEDALMRSGKLNKRAMMNPRNQMFNQLKNPRAYETKIEPRFLAKVVVDVSGSMDGAKLYHARKLLVFYAELFNEIEKKYGFIRFSLEVFSDGIAEIKAFDQKYESPQRYRYPDSSEATVKARLMSQVVADGGTDMLPAIQRAVIQLDAERRKYPGYTSALYYIGDGQDSYGNGPNIKKYLEQSARERGNRAHLVSAILLGQPWQRSSLADIFGDEHTTVAEDYKSLLDQSMKAFKQNMDEYLKRIGLKK